MARVPGVRPRKHQRGGSRRRRRPFARFASRPANLVPGPPLGYTPALAGLQWPSGAGNEQTSTASVAVDSRGHIFVYHHPGVGRPPLLEFDATGRFVKAFGSELQIVRAHGMRIDAGDNVWITDVKAHTVSKLDRNGKLLMTLGKVDRESGKLVAVAGRGYGKAPDQFGEAHFMAMNARGDIYIADTGPIAS